MMLTTLTTTTRTVQAGGNGGSKRFQKYIPCATEAHQRAEDEAGRREPGVINPGNLELVYFLRAVKRQEDGNEAGRSGWAFGLQKAAQNVGAHPTRIRTAQQLKEVKGVGEYTAKLIAEVLWARHPPADPDSEEEQLEMEMRQQTAALPAAGREGCRGGGRGRGRGGRGAAMAAALGPHDIPFGDSLVVPVAGVDGGDADNAGAAPTGRGRGRRRSRGRGGAGAGRGRGRGKRSGPEVDLDNDGNGSDDGGELAALAAMDLNAGASHGHALGHAGTAWAGAAAVAYDVYGGGPSQAGLALGAGGGGVQGVVEAPPRKRARRQSDEGAGQECGYAPNPGSANYAFLIVMYMAWKREKRRHWEKEELMAATQASGLAEKDIHGVKDLSAPGKVSNFYDGWSCFRSMINRDPPIAGERTKSKGARGKEFTLTNLGWALAARLYKSALRYREVQPLPGVSEEQVDEDIRRYCAVEEVEPLLQAYPNGTPRRCMRGRAYKGFEPGPRPDRDGGAAAAALSVGVTSTTVVVAAAPGRQRAPSRPRGQRTSGTGGLCNEDLFDGGVDDGYALFGSQGGLGSRGELGSQGGGLGLGPACGLAATQGLGLGPTSAPPGAALGGVPAALVGFARPGLNLADVFTSAGQAYDSGVRGAGFGSGLSAVALAPTSGVRHRTGGVVGSGAGGSSQAARPSVATVATVAELQQLAAAAPATVAIAPAAAATTAAERRRSSAAAARPDVVNLLDSSDDGDGSDDDGDDGDGGDDEYGGAGAMRPAYGSDLALDTSFMFTLQSAGRASRDGLGALASQPSPQAVPQQQQQHLEALQALPDLGGFGPAATTRAAAGGVSAGEQSRTAVAAGAVPAKRPRRPAVKEEHVAQLVEMGFDRAMACKALRREGGDLSSALDRLDDGTLSPVGKLSSSSSSEEEADGTASVQARELPLPQRLRGNPTGISGDGAGLPPAKAARMTAVAAPLGPAAALQPRARPAKKAAAGVAAAAAAEAEALAVTPTRAGPGPAPSESQPPPQQRLGSGELARSGSGPAPGMGGRFAGSPEDPLGARLGSQLLPYRVGSGSQQPDPCGSQDAEAGDGSDDRTLCSYEWMLPRVSEVTANHRELPVRLPPLPPGKRFEEVYDVVLLLDNREPASLVEAVRGAAAAQGVRVVAGMSLTVGDFLWVAARRGAPLSQAGKQEWFLLDAVLERKCTSDLLSSVRDGRYGQQKYRLKRCGLRRLYYLLEEPINPNKFQGMEEKALRTSIQSGLLEGFTVLRTTDLPDTARQLCMLTRALERQCRGRTGPAATGASAGLDAEDVLPSYTAWDAGLKNLKQNMKVQAMFGLMLCTVPGVGEERANRVLARYSTPAFLWDAYKAAMRGAVAAGRDPTTAAEQLLAGEVGGQCSARLYQMLFSKGVSAEQVLGLTGR